MTMELFAVCVFGLGVALVINILFNRWGIPVVIGYITAGVFIASYLHLTDFIDQDLLDHIAEFGIVFLMFTIGLEFSFPTLRSMRQEVIVFGGLQVILSTLAVFLVAFFAFNLGISASLIIAMALSLSSTAIVLKSFNESKEINTPHGRNAVGILIMQDIAVIPMLLLISILGSGNAHLEFLVIHTTLNALVLVLLLFYPIKWVIATLLQYAAHTRMDEIFVGAILFIIFASSLLAHLFGFSYSLGAFIAGMIIAGTRYKHQADLDLMHFRDLLLGIFFVTVGMQVNVAFLFANIHWILVFLVGIMLLKALVLFVIIRFYRSTRTSFKTALSLCQVGEFSFVLFSLSSGHLGLVDANTHQFLVLCVIFSMICTPFILKNLATIADRVLGIFGKKGDSFLENEGSYSVLQDHVVVCGYGVYGKEVVRYLKEHNTGYIAIDSDIERVNEAYRNNDNIVFGSMRQKSIYETLRIDECAAVVLTLDDSDKTRMICNELLSTFPDCHIIVQTPTYDDMQHLSGLKLHTLICAKAEIATILGSAAVECVQEKSGHEGMGV